MTSLALSRSDRPKVFGGMDNDITSKPEAIGAATWAGLAAGSILVGSVAPAAGAVALFCMCLALTPAVDGGATVLGFMKAARVVSNVATRARMRKAMASAHPLQRPETSRHKPSRVRKTEADLIQASAREDLGMARDVWHARDYRAFAWDNDKLIVKTSPGTSIEVKTDQISFHGEKPPRDKDYATVMQHAKTLWGGEIAMTGVSPSENMRAWAHAQVEGVKVQGYKPSPSEMKEANALKNSCWQNAQKTRLRKCLPQRPQRCLDLAESWK